MLTKRRLDTTNTLYHHSINAGIRVLPEGPTFDPLYLLSLFQVTLVADNPAIPRRHDDKADNLLPAVTVQILCIDIWH